MECGMNQEFIVVCRECGEHHFTEEVTFLNIEENIQGHDIMYFVCPVTNNKTKSSVYKK